MAADTFPAGLCVLAVDDDCVCLKVLERQLKYCNYNATMVTSAQTALDMLREREDDGNQFDLVITNVGTKMEGFKLLEIIGLEMDLPVIMLSVNNEIKTIMKGIKHGACDYIVKPVRLEQLRGIWTHVVKNNKTKTRNNINIGDGGKGEKDGTNHIKYSKKNKKVMNVAEEENENTSAHSKQRVQWCGQLHQKFVEAIRQIGLERAVPKKILEIMNVKGLTRENVASHLQKYRIYLRKFNEGTLKNSNPFTEETEALRRNMNGISFIGSPSSRNHLVNLNSSSATRTQAFLSTQSVHVMSSQKNLGIHVSNMGLVGQGINLPKEAIPMPVHDISRCISSGKSNAPVLSVGLPGASQGFPCGPSGSFVANLSNDVPLNASKPSSRSLFENCSNDSPPLTSNMGFSSSHSSSSYASTLRATILGSSRGIPFEDVADGEMLAPSGDLQLQSHELVKQPSAQLQSYSTDLFNKVAREDHQFAGSSNSWKAIAPSRLSDLVDNGGTSEDPTHDNILKITQLSRIACFSSQISTFRNEFQKTNARIMGEATPVVGFKEQVAPFTFGNNTHAMVTPIGNSTLASSSSTRPDPQVNNPAMITQVLNGGGASDNLRERSIVNQQALSDHVNNINEFLMVTSQAQNMENDDLDDFIDSLVNQDFINNGDSFINRDREFAP